MSVRYGDLPQPPPVPTEHEDDISCPHGCDGCAEEYMKTAYLRDAVRTFLDVVDSHSNWVYATDEREAISELRTAMEATETAAVKDGADE